MNAASIIIGLAVGGTAMAGIGVRLIVGMTRLVDSVDQLRGQFAADGPFERLAEAVGDHEKRLIRAGL